MGYVLFGCLNMEHRCRQAKIDNLELEIEDMRATAKRGKWLEGQVCLDIWLLANLCLGTWLCHIPTDRLTWD